MKWLLLQIGFTVVQLNFTNRALSIYGAVRLHIIIRGDSYQDHHMSSSTRITTCFLVAPRPGARTRTTMHSESESGSESGTAVAGAAVAGAITFSRSSLAERRSKAFLPRFLLAVVLERYSRHKGPDLVSRPTLRKEDGEGKERRTRVRSGHPRWSGASAHRTRVPCRRS